MTIPTLLLGLVFVGPVVFADNLTSTSFQVENPMLIISSGEATSTSFRYISTTGQLVNGESASMNYTGLLGFLYFPTATTPTISATAGDAQASLSWTSATGVLANVTSYSIGLSTTLNGTYIYEDVGNVSTYTKTGLINGITYYFKVKSYAAGIVLSESDAVSATPAGTTSGGGGGGGGGGSGAISGNPSVNSSVVFSGIAYPGSKVVLLKDSTVVAETPAGPDANFSISLSNLAVGTYSFAVKAVDANGLSSNLHVYSIYVSSGVTTNVTGIFIAPTISVDKSEVKRGDVLTVIGQSAPEAQVALVFNSETKLLKNTNSNISGNWVYKLNTLELEYGDHEVKARAVNSYDITPFSSSLSFVIGNTNKLAVKNSKVYSKYDITSDGRVNISDFSVLVYWINRKGPPAKVDLNGDGKVNLADFSILAYYWTG